MQGFNMGRYYPPSTTSPPTFNTPSNRKTTHPPTVRFELPFPVWCLHCKPESIIGQGVRFNATKNAVGKYFTTTIWSFGMRHSACGGSWEIRTDPERGEYVCMTGCRVREGWGRGLRGGEADGVDADGEVVVLTEEEREKRREDAFAALEGQGVDKVVEERGKERVDELLERGEVWRDPWERNRRLRREFREDRKGREREEGRKEVVRERFGLGVELLDEVESDGKRARLVEFGREVGIEERVGETLRKPMFGNTGKEMKGESGSKVKKLKSESLAEQRRRTLQQTMVSNTRAAIDPFLSDDVPSSTRTKESLIPGLKRKRVEEPPKITTEATDTPTTHLITASKGVQVPAKSAPRMALVDYDSD
ncbi:hypothetical protein P154DRAFT_554881 [Amniculicola lignicola CBS 123094]|uniref:DUF572-domain-containing protein n=1 Tax=Amniculicola lignicola CBS 123094 TaxID=1392246 RepID=A0A6A5WBK5_9PLEO|nr:hypothetical protein P154DRAFT_554881 [Amniculicola lignicola CBS 123094]